MKNDRIIESVWIKKHIGKNYQISIPNIYKEIKKENVLIFFDGTTKSIVINNVQGKYEEPQIVLYSIWKKIIKDKGEKKLDICCRIFNGDKQYKFEIVYEKRFFIFVLVVGEDEQILIELSTSIKEKEATKKEYYNIINTIRKKRGEK